MQSCDKSMITARVGGPLLRSTFAKINPRAEKKRMFDGVAVSDAAIPGIGEGCDIAVKSCIASTKDGVLRTLSSVSWTSYIWCIFFLAPLLHSESDSVLQSD